MNALLLDYEYVLIGKNKNISPFNFYGAAPGGANEKKALQCIKYALEELLGWDIQKSREQFDAYMIHLLKLERLVEYVVFPPEIEFGDPRYILSLIYPTEIRLNQKQLIEEMYQRVIDGVGQFPREYFLGQKGFYRFCVCLCYLISNYKPFSDIEELFDFFSTSEGRQFLDDYRLKTPLEHLNIDLLKCLETITSDNEDSGLYYAYYKFKTQWKNYLSLGITRENPR